MPIGALTGLALILHELATNAVKYGALKTEHGRVTVGWQTDGEQLELRWVERGGSPLETTVPVPGFGTTLVNNTAVNQFGGKLERDWSPDGLAVTITVPIPALTV